MRYHFIVKKGQYKDSNPLITAKNMPFDLIDGNYVLAEVENVGTLEMYRGLFTVTSGGQIYISAYQKMIMDDWNNSGWRLLGLHKKKNKRLM